jgi:hypothetical protein
MSASLAAAKKRRANIQEPTRVQSQSENSATPPIGTGLTLPQVIQIVDNRLIILEKFMRETTESRIVGNNANNNNANNNNANNNMQLSLTNDTFNPDEATTPVDITEVIEEFDSRYKMLAEEITNLKNIVLSLQSYTMEVNKTLLEERVRIFSDLDKDSTLIGTD